MNWRDKAAAIVANTPSTELTEPPKLPFVGFVGSTPSHISPRTAEPNTSDPAAEARMARALAYLEAHPEAIRACFADVKSDPAHVVLTVALREPWCALEMLVNRKRFDAMALMELSLRYPGTSVFVPVH